MTRRKPSGTDELAIKLAALNAEVKGLRDLLREDWDGDYNLDKATTAM